MRSQPQIIVRRQVDNFLAVEGANRRLLVVEHAQLEVCALRFKLIELVGEIRKWIGADCSRHEYLKLLAADLRGSMRIYKQLSLMPKEGSRRMEGQVK